MVTPVSLRLRTLGGWFLVLEAQWLSSWSNLSADSHPRAHNLVLSQPGGLQPQQSQSGAENLEGSWRALVLSQQWDWKHWDEQKQLLVGSTRQQREAKRVYLVCYRRPGVGLPHQWGQQDSSSLKAPFSGDSNLWQAYIKTKHHSCFFHVSIQVVPWRKTFRFLLMILEKDKAILPYSWHELSKREVLCLDTDIFIAGYVS